MNSDLVRDMRYDGSNEHLVSGGDDLVQTFESVVLWPVDRLALSLGCDPNVTIGDDFQINRRWGRTLLWACVLVGLLMLMYQTVFKFIRRYIRGGKRKREGYKFFNEDCGASFYPCSGQKDGVLVSSLPVKAGHIDRVSINTSSLPPVSDSSGGYRSDFSMNDVSNAAATNLPRDDTSNATATPVSQQESYQAPEFHEPPSHIRRLENRQQEAIRLYNKMNAERQRRVDASSETPTPNMPWEQYWSEYKRDNHVDY